MCPPNLQSVAYLGDGVYVGHDDCQIWLLTGSHDHPNNTIALEPRVWELLQAYVGKVNQKEVPAE